MKSVKLIGTVLGALLMLPLQAETLSILKVGGKNDGKTLNTQAIAKGIDQLAAKGGGTLYFPAGTYLTGPITMKSNITLYVEAGATLSFTDDFDQYMPYVEMRYEGVVMKSFHPLIGGWDLENIAIKGEGTLDGNGQAWWNESWRIEGALRSREDQQGPTKYQLAFDEANPDLTLEPQSDWKGTLARRFFRPPFIQFMRCRNILIEGLHIQNSPFWTVNPEFCDNLNITGLTINNPPSPNTDGINPSSCRNVHISNCHISVGDDCITIKSGRDLQGRQYGTPCENITITNCTMLNGHGGVVIGSEMSGDVRKVTISNCVFDGTDRGIRIKSTRGRGGIVEEIRVNNIVMKDIKKEAIILTLFYSRVGEEPVSERTPIFRNIHIANMTGSQVKSVGSIMGITEMPISNVSISNVNIEAETGMRVQDARELTFSDFTVSTQRGPALDIENSEELYLSNVRTYRPSAEVPVMMLRNVRDAMITACFPMPGSKALAEISGENTAGIVVCGNYVERLSTPFIIGEEVPSDAIVK
ncbi:MAG: glycoside hydrolase family 28 protein [Bacteroidales bacterium]|nr:glycoside hydrolase family 28 protein [Bacteroidales bacterium]